MLQSEKIHMDWIKSKVMPSKESDFLKLKGVDYIELYVGNVPQAVHFYRTVFGFTPIAYAGLETGVRDRVSTVVEQGNIRLVLTGPLDSDSSIAEHVKLHGDGVKDIAFTVDDAAKAFEVALKRGAKPLLEPTIYENQEELVIQATISAYGDTVHSFIQRTTYDDTFFPTYKTIKNPLTSLSTGLVAIDHIAISVEQGELDQWIDFYNRVLGFHELQNEMISTDYSAMNSKVVQNSTGCIKFPILEPATGKCKSQIEEYLTFYNGSGTQHIALLSNDIVETVRALRANDVEFLPVPGIYYNTLEERIGKLDENLTMALRELQILVDLDEWGYLMQIFTKPLQNRPTLFLEIIQRQGARGFGRGNIKALFEAVEHEQIQRWNI